MFGLWGARRFGAVGDGGRLKSSSSWKPTEGKEVENKQTILNEIDFSLGFVVVVEFLGACFHKKLTPTLYSFTPITSPKTTISPCSGISLCGI